VGGMIENGRSHAGLFDYPIAIANRRDPAQVRIERAKRTAAGHQSSARGVVRDCVEHLARGFCFGIYLLDARVDDLDRGRYVFGGAQYVEDGAVRPSERLAPHT